MEKMKTLFQESKKRLEAYSDQNVENGYSLIMWDDERMIENTRGKSKAILRQLAWILGRKIGLAIKADLLSFDTLQVLVRRTNEVILAGALEAIKERAGSDWLNREAAAYAERSVHGEIEKQLAEKIWREAETDD